MKNPEEQINTLGILYIVLGGLQLLGGLFFTFLGAAFFSQAGNIKEEMMREMPAQDAQMVEPVMTVMTWAFPIIGLLIVAYAIASILAGMGLRKKSGTARIFVIIMGALSLPSIPVGTALGIYTFWVLFNDEVKQIFDEHQYSQ